MSETKTKSAKAAGTKTAATKDKTPAVKAAKVSIPDISEFLKAGVQFGHQTKKWNPKMKKFIYSSRDQIHIIDISKTLPALEEAMQFLVKASAEGPILFVGTKRQASDLVKDAAVDAGAFFIVHRWPGGLLTNFDMVQRSLKKFRGLEDEFEHGVEDRTKFEVSQMKKDWEKMNRLYEGVKTMSKYPSAIVLVDSKYEKNAVREAKVANVPVVAIVDTNSDPENVDYPIPANDDAIKSISLVVSLLGKAVKHGHAGKGIKHNLTDYSNYEVKLIKKEVTDEPEVKEISTGTVTVQPEPRKVTKAPARKSGETGKGLLEQIQEETEKKRKSVKK